jgi:hypothetical protein
MIQIVVMADVRPHASVQSWHEFRAVVWNQTASPVDQLICLLFHASLDSVPTSIG